MKRWQEDKKITEKEWKAHRQSHVNSNLMKQRYVGQDPNEVDCECDNQVGRFRKKRAFDCGRPHCGLCHSDKYPKRSLTNQEIKAKLAFKEQLK